MRAGMSRAVWLAFITKRQQCSVVWCGGVVCVVYVCG